MGAWNRVIERLPVAGRRNRQRPDQVIAVDLGRRTTKAAGLIRKGGEFVSSGCGMADSPVYERAPSPEQVAEARILLRPASAAQVVH